MTEETSEIKVNPLLAPWGTFKARRGWFLFNAPVLFSWKTASLWNKEEQYSLRQALHELASAPLLFSYKITVWKVNPDVRIVK